MTSLVLLTGLPAVGKSVTAERLARKYGFAILSTDDLRSSLFLEDYGETIKNGGLKEKVVRKVLDSSKVQILSGGFNLVIDASSPTDSFRRRMLELPKNLEQEVEKSVLYIQADDSVLYLRQEARGRTNEAIETIRGYWDEPQERFSGASGATLYKINNNESLDQLYEKVDTFYKNLKRKGKGS